MVDHVLVDRRARRDEDRDARVLAPAGPPELLPRRGDRARVARQDRGVEPADVDAQLERVGRDDAEDLAVAQAALDRAPLRRQVAAAVAADARARAASSRAATRAGRSAAARPRPASARTRSSGALPAGTAAPSAGRASRPSCVPRSPDGGSADRPAGRGARPEGAPVRSMTRLGRPVSIVGELARVPDRRRAADDDRRAAVVRADPQQPAEDVGDVAAEDAAVRVELVDRR